MDREGHVLIKEGKIHGREILLQDTPEGREKPQNARDRPDPRRKTV